MRVDSLMHRECFNIIESSNVVDYLGLLNVLAASRPLLSTKPDAVLFSETLLRTTESDISIMNKLTMADIREVGILLNLMPLGHLVGVLANSTLSEAVGRMDDGPYSGRVQMTWKAPALGDLTAYNKSGKRPYIRPVHLATVLYEIFSKMFEDEALAVYAQKRIRAQASALSNLSQYTRASFVCLIQTIKLMVDTD